MSEIGGGNQNEKDAIAWAVRNQMYRLGTRSVARAAAHFDDRHGKSATADNVAIAHRILRLPMSGDVAQGAIKWFSPNSMPKEGQSCAGIDCSGGLIDVPGIPKKVFAPGYHNDMTYVPLSGVKEIFLRFYKLS